MDTKIGSFSEPEMADGTMEVLRKLKAEALRLLQGRGVSTVYWIAAHSRNSRMNCCGFDGHAVKLTRSSSTQSVA